MLFHRRQSSIVLLLLLAFTTTLMTTITSALSRKALRCPKPCRQHDGVAARHCHVALSSSSSSSSSQLAMSDWSDFAALDDDDDDDDLLATTNNNNNNNNNNMDVLADEDDSQEFKAQVGAALEPPSIERDAEPILVPQGSVLPLTVDNVLGVLAACRDEIGTLFGYSAENRGVGITGGVDYVDLDGPIVILSLKGRFWHQRPTVLARVGAYLRGRIPEIVDVIVEDEWQLTDEANNQAM